MTVEHSVDTAHHRDLTKLFPGSDGTIPATPSGRELRRQARLDWNRRHPVLRVLLWGGLSVGALTSMLGMAGVFVADAWDMMPMVIYGAPAMFVTGVILLLVVSARHSQASDLFFERYGSARGLEARGVEEDILGIDIPLFARGDKRKVLRILSGQIVDTHGMIAQYRYTEVTSDSKGNRSETHFPFTVVVLPLPAPVAARFAGVYLRTRMLGSGWFGGLGPDRNVQLDSSELHQVYDLRVIDEQDDIALFELMSTPFIRWLVELSPIDDERVQFEQQSGHLVVFMRSHPEEAWLLDSVVDAAAHIYRRYCEEHM